MSLLPWLVAQGTAVPVVPVAAGSFGAETTVVAAAIVTVLAALVAGTVSVINAVSAAGDRRASREERAALMVTTKNTEHTANGIMEKAVEIHAVANGTLSKMSTALDVANEKIHGLEKLMAAMLATNSAAEVARARLEQPPGSPAPSPPGEFAHVDEPVKVEVVNLPLATVVKAEPGAPFGRRAADQPA